MEEFKPASIYRPCDNQLPVHRKNTWSSCAVYLQPAGACAMILCGAPCTSNPSRRRRCFCQVAQAGHKQGETSSDSIRPDHLTLRRFAGYHPDVAGMVAGRQPVSSRIRLSSSRRGPPSPTAASYPYPSMSTTPQTKSSIHSRGWRTRFTCGRTTASLPVQPSAYALATSYTSTSGTACPRTRV